MKEESKIALDFVIDKLTNSIENALTGDSFRTEVSLLNGKEDLNSIKKLKGWQFDWTKEFLIPSREVYKLTIVDNSSVIQGLISLEVQENFVIMHLIENAPFNKGKKKVYLGVAGNLVAFACRLSFQRGGEGYVLFLAKSKLLKHYEQNLGAIHIGNHKMVINTQAALVLTNKYFN
jgi:hypothetical protein